MPEVKSAWLLPTDEVIHIGTLSHADVVINFLSGLFEVDEALGKYCFNDLQKFLERKDYNKMKIADVIEDYAVLNLRWIKRGNAYGFNDNHTVTIANYDSAIEKIQHYQAIGWYVNVVDIQLHTYMRIEHREYEKLNVQHIVALGANVREKYINLFPNG